jgi:hypothetical protein
MEDFYRELAMNAQQDALGNEENSMPNDPRLAPFMMGDVDRS